MEYTECLEIEIEAIDGVTELLETYDSLIELKGIIERRIEACNKKAAEFKSELDAVAGV